MFSHPCTENVQVKKFSKKAARLVILGSLLVGTFVYALLGVASPSHFNPGSEWSSSANFWPTLMETWNWHGDVNIYSSLLVHDHVARAAQPDEKNLKSFLKEFSAAREDLNLLSGVSHWQIEKNELKSLGLCRHLRLEGHYHDAKSVEQSFVEEHAYCGEKLRVFSVIAPRDSTFWKTSELQKATEKFIATAGTGQ